MPHPILILRFPASRSKNYREVINIAKEFNGFKQGEVNIVPLSIKEIFEKWEFFNLLFWRTVDWKGTTLSFEDMCYHSHCDKTRIFYAMQQAHLTWICCYEHLISKLHKVYTGVATLEELKIETETEYDIDRILDDFTVLKARESYHEKYGEMDFMNPKERSFYKKWDRKIQRQKKDGESETDNSIPPGPAPAGSQKNQCPGAGKCPPGGGDPEVKTGRKTAALRRVFFEISLKKLIGPRKALKISS